jgi:hypothetical protein
MLALLFRLWRNEVEHKKIERTLQLAAEMRQQQKMALIQASMGSNLPQLSEIQRQPLVLGPSIVYCMYLNQPAL